VWGAVGRNSISTLSYHRLGDTAENVKFFLQKQPHCNEKYLHKISYIFLSLQEWKEIEKKEK